MTQQFRWVFIDSTSCISHVRCSQFLLGLLAHSPDLSLDELKEELWHRHRLSVSLSTLCMTLKELDLPRKQVRCANSIITISMFIY